MRKKSIYLIGSMEGRQLRDVLEERGKIVGKLRGMGYKVLDPLEKEITTYKRNVKKTDKIQFSCTTLTCRDIFKMDIGCVEKADILLWYTANLRTEGSETEFAVGGAWNRYIKKPKKVLIMVDSNMNENRFQSCWSNLFHIRTIEEAYDILIKLNIKETAIL